MFSRLDSMLVGKTEAICVIFHTRIRFGSLRLAGKRPREGKNQGVEAPPRDFGLKIHIFTQKIFLVNIFFTEPFFTALIGNI